MKKLLMALVGAALLMGLAAILMPAEAVHPPGRGRCPNICEGGVYGCGPCEVLDRCGCCKKEPGCKI